MRTTENTQENFPFLTAITRTNDEYIGIIINQDAFVTSIYDYGSIKTDIEKTRFIELGEIWWWESNRQIPINIFIGRDMDAFKYIIKNFMTKNVEVLFGPVTSLTNIITKRVKRKSISVVKKHR